MSNMHFQLYLNDILALARSLVIKSGDTAETINNNLVTYGYKVDLDQPNTWKYYMNLAGMYHPVDRMMRVVSMDTHTEIDFTVENLRTHRATASEYKVGSSFYNELVARHPDQVDLIHGILAPVDIQKAIDAQDGYILYFDPTYVESNETQLIEQLQIWIYGFYNRWYNQQYLLTDDLYLPAFLGILHLYIPQQIQLIRLRAIKTPKVHSFHIRQYLASNGRLDKYLPFLTKKQQLFLYRNLTYLRRNVGKQETFDTLIDNILTERGLPLSWYKLRHNVEHLPDSTRPDIEMVKHPINFTQSQPGVVVESVHTILDREYGVARHNPEVLVETEEDIKKRFGRGAFSQLPTKVLESEVIDRSNSSVRPLESVLVNHWLYLASEGRYRAYVHVTNPANGELISMSVRDAFIIAMYAFAKTRDIELDSIPRVIAYDVLRRQLPNYDELSALVDMRYVGQEDITTIMDNITPLGEYISVESFNEAGKRLHREYLRLWELYSLQEHYISRGLAEHVARAHFQHIKCELVDEVVAFEVWLRRNGYTITNLTHSDLDTLYHDIVSAATGLNLTNQTTLAEVQEAMLGLMGQLSSYSVQYLRNINIGDFHYVAQPDIRIGDLGGKYDSNFRVYMSRVTALRERYRPRQRYALHNDKFFTSPELGVFERARFCIDVDLPIRQRPQNIARVVLDTSRIGVLGYSFTVHDTNPGDDLGQYIP